MSWKYTYWHHQNFFNKKERKLLSEFIEKNYDFIEHKDETAKDDNGISKKKTKTFITNLGRVKHLTKNLKEVIEYDNANNFGYNLYPINDLSKILLNIYSSKNSGEYGWHSDSAQSDLNDCKLTVLANLSDEYEGGDLHFFEGRDVVVKDFNPGALLLLKSYINHKVDPVTKGTRKTLTMFLNGPKFR